MINSFPHDGLERFCRTGLKAGIEPKPDKKLRSQLTAADAAAQPGDFAAILSWRHALQMRHDLRDHLEFPVTAFAGFDVAAECPLQTLRPARKILE